MSKMYKTAEKTHKLIFTIFLKRLLFLLRKEVYYRAIVNLQLSPPPSIGTVQSKADD